MRSHAIRLRICLAIGLSTCVLLLSALPPAALGAGGQSVSPTPSEDSRRLPGVELARTLATVTGIAITPLLGVSAVGAWNYYKAESSARTDLPWYASLWFWIPGLIVGLLLVLKDPLLGLIPGVKKPLDALDVLENKVSAVVAAPAVVPMFVTAFTAAGATSLATGSGGLRRRTIS